MSTSVCFFIGSPTRPKPYSLGRKGLWADRGEIEMVVVPAPIVMQAPPWNQMKPPKKRKGKPTRCANNFKSPTQYEPQAQKPEMGAKTRRGTPCQAPAVKGKSRCRMHGGAPGSGAPKGNKNALKHGLCTKAAMEEQRSLREFMRDSRQKLEEIE